MALCLYMGGWACLCPSYPSGAEEARVSIDFPPNGSAWDRPCSTALVSGSLRAAETGREPLYDVALVIDTSGSTILPSGSDIDGDGIIGEIPKSPNNPSLSVMPPSTDPDDSVLAAEVAGARRLLRLLHPATTQVALIQFGGDILPGGHSDPAVPDASLEQPLTQDYGRVRESLDRLLAKGPSGGTNVAAGVRAGIEEVMGLNPQGGRPRPGSKKLILFLTDGAPSFPVGTLETDSEDKILAISAADIAREAGIGLALYVIGSYALSSPATMKEMARITQGRYIPVSDPGRIVTVLEETKFLDLSALQVANVTLNLPATRILLTPEGYYIAEVPIRQGINRIRATVTAPGGRLVHASVQINCLGEQGGKELSLNLSKDDFSSLKLALDQERERLLKLTPLKEPVSPKEQLELELEVQPSPKK